MLARENHPMLKIQNRTHEARLSDVNHLSVNNVNELPSNISSVAMSTRSLCSMTQPTSPSLLTQTIPSIAHFHLYLSPTVITAVEDLSSNNVTKNKDDTFSFKSTPLNDKYKINIYQALRNIIDFVKKNSTHQVRLWTDTNSKAIIKKSMVDSELSPVLFEKIVLSDIHEFFNGWNYDAKEKKFLYTFFRQEMVGSGKNLAAAKDIAQYAVLEAYGGLGIDCDITTMKEIGLLQSTTGILIALSIKHGLTTGISNAVIAAVPQHSTIHKTLEHINHTYQGNFHPIPERKLYVSRIKTCAINCAFTHEGSSLTEQESVKFLAKTMNEDKRFNVQPKWIAGRMYKSARLGITMAATGPRALFCALDRMQANTHENVEAYSFENVSETFGHLTSSETLKDALTDLRENKVQKELPDDGNSWTDPTSRKRRDSF